MMLPALRRAADLCRLVARRGAQNAARREVRSPSFYGRGKPKRELIRNELPNQCSDRGSDRNDLMYDPSEAAPSDEEYDPSPDSLVMRLEGKCNEPVLPILHQWIKDGKETPDRIVAALKRLKWLGRFKHAFEISDFLIHERCLELQKFHYLNHLELLGRCLNMKAAEEFLEKMPRAYSRSQAAQMVMFEGYIANEAMRNAKIVLRAMKNQGCLATATEFNKLFELCANKNKGEHVALLLRDMKDFCISPNVETYEILIGIKASNGDVAGMLRLHNKMLSDGDGKTNSNINCTLAAGYVKAGMFKEATHHLQLVVEDQDFRKSRKLHDKAIALYATMGKGEQVDKLWRFSKRFPVISANSYIATIVAYEKMGQVEKAEDVFLELEKKKGVLSTRHYNALLKVFSERNLMQKSEKLLGRMSQIHCSLDRNTYHHLITGYIRSGNPQMAIETMKKLLNDHIKPSYETMLLVLQIHAENADVDSAEELFQNMKRESYHRNVEAYNTVLKTYVRADKHAYRFLQRMALDKVQPDATTFAMLNKMKPIPKMSQPAAPLNPSFKKPSPY